MKPHVILEAAKRLERIPCFKRETLFASLEGDTGLIRHSEAIIREAEASGGVAGPPHEKSPLPYVGEDQGEGELT